METRKFVLFSTFYPPYHLGGDATHVENLANTLSKIGHEVHVVHILDSYNFKKGNTEVKCKTEIEVNDVTIHRLKSSFGNLSLFKAYILNSSNYYFKKSNEIVKKINPDIIHHHNIAGFGPSILKFKPIEKKIYTAHDYWLVCQNSGLIKPEGSSCQGPEGCFYCQIRHKRPYQLWRGSKKVHKSIASINSIIAPSNYMEKCLTDLGIECKIVVIPNFVMKPVTPFIPIEKRTHILFVGVLNEHKGILDLLSNYSNIYKKNGIKLHIVGTGPLEKTIVEYVSTNGMGDMIQLLGKLPNQELSYQYSTALAVIIPSKWPENNPMVALEALSHGTPVIGKSVGGIPEIINILDSRLLYNTNDGLSDAIKVIRDEQTHFQKAIQLFNSTYSQSAYMNKYYDLINEND